MRKNRYAIMSSQLRRQVDGTARRELDDYETPEQATEALCRHVRVSNVLEPACGSGRMVRVLRRRTRVRGTDIKGGHDFLKRARTWPGDIVTNPPYGLADEFLNKALEIADGRVCMLMQSGFLWGSGRGKLLYEKCPPDKIVILSGRIYFYVDGRESESQFFSHCWICWPSRRAREKGGYETTVAWSV